jgi:drug/metabolite transporter (DMT)-like permease
MLACLLLWTDAVLLAALIFGESLETRKLSGCGAVVTGILLAAVPSRRRPE